jgi:hypothetical protein
MGTKFATSGKRFVVVWKALGWCLKTSRKPESMGIVWAKVVITTWQIPRHDVSIRRQLSDKLLVQEVTDEDMQFINI